MFLALHTRMRRENISPCTHFSILHLFFQYIAYNCFSLYILLLLLLFLWCPGWVQEVSFSHYNAGAQHLSLHMFFEIYLNLLFQSLLLREGTASFTCFVFVRMIHGPDQAGCSSLLLTLQLTGITIFHTRFRMFPLVILIFASYQNHSKPSLYNNQGELNHLLLHIVMFQLAFPVSASRWRYWQLSSNPQQCGGQYFLYCPLCLLTNISVLRCQRIP